MRRRIRWTLLTILQPLLVVAAAACDGPAAPDGDPAPRPQLSGSSLRFYGNGVNDIDRVKIPIDDPRTTNPGPPADLGAADFAIEFWVRGSRTDNATAAVTVATTSPGSTERRFGGSPAGPIWSTETPLPR